jgi:hypothetical protein
MQKKEHNKSHHHIDSILGNFKIRIFNGLKFKALFMIKYFSN